MRILKKGAVPRLRITVRMTSGSLCPRMPAYCFCTAAKLARAFASEKLPASWTPQGAQAADPCGAEACRAADPAPGCDSAAAISAQVRACSGAEAGSTGADASGAAFFQSLTPRPVMNQT
jgi:hypothetical protein